jgi:hypothetical protein
MKLVEFSSVSNSSYKTDGLLESDLIRFKLLLLF